MYDCPIDRAQYFVYNLFSATVTLGKDLQFVPINSQEVPLVSTVAWSSIVTKAKKYLEGNKQGKILLKLKEIMHFQINIDIH